MLNDSLTQHPGLRNEVYYKHVHSSLGRETEFRFEQLAAVTYLRIDLLLGAKVRFRVTEELLVSGQVSKTAGH
jgi:hypothetical protein